VSAITFKFRQILVCRHLTLCTAITGVAISPAGTNFMSAFVVVCHIVPPIVDLSIRWTQTSFLPKLHCLRTVKQIVSRYNSNRTIGWEKPVIQAI
jgi:hypothetical protein